MKNKKLMITLFLVFVFITIFIYLLLNSKISAYSTLSYEKCQETNDDDCWHSLAHQTFNREYCLKITDNGTKEHCLEHIPQINNKEGR